MNAPLHHPLLFEMVRSFTTLARELNLSRAVEVLGSTRQTVRRHITLLEVARGERLFDIIDRRYEITEAGKAALPEAFELQSRAKAWLEGRIGSSNNLQYLTATSGDWEFLQQEQPIGRIWTDAKSALLRETFRAWAMAGAEIEHACFQHVRPYLIIFRHTEAGWVCTEFGEKSYYVAWFGSDFARSSIGRPMRRMPAGEEFATLVDEAFHQVEATQSARLDHVYTRMPNKSVSEFLPVTYQRLMLAGRFPDGSPAVLSLIEPTVDVEIYNFDPAEIRETILSAQPQLEDLATVYEEQANEKLVS